MNKIKVAEYLMPSELITQIISYIHIETVPWGEGHSPQVAVYTVINGAGQVVNYYRNPNSHLYGVINL